MKKTLLLTTVCAALTACGGGSGGSNGGDNPSPTPPTPTTTCTLPTIASTTTYYGVTPAGDTGTWTFTQNGTSLSVSNTVTAAFAQSSTSNTFTATATSNNCAYTTTNSSIQGIATAFNGDLAISASQNGNRPAFLIANPTTTQANIAGTYNIVDFEKQVGGTATSSYRQIVVDTGGTTGTIYKWNNGTRTARHQISLVPNGQGFTLNIVPNATYEDTVIEPVGTAYFKVSGSSKLVALAVADIDLQGGPQTQTTGMWLGSTDSTTLPTGYYVDNFYDESAYTSAWTGGITATSTTITPNSGSAITYQVNQPQTGFIGLPVESGMPVDAAVSSALGFFAATTQYDSSVGPLNTAAGGASVTFSVRPQQ